MFRRTLLAGLMAFGIGAMCTTANAYHWGPGGYGYYGGAPVYYGGYYSAPVYSVPVYTAPVYAYPSYGYSSWGYNPVGYRSVNIGFSRGGWGGGYPGFGWGGRRSGLSIGFSSYRGGWGW